MSAYTEMATGTERPGRRVRYRTLHEQAAAGAYAAVTEAHDDPLTRRKRSRVLGHQLPDKWRWKGK